MKSPQDLASQILAGKKKVSHQWEGQLWVPHRWEEFRLQASAILGCEIAHGLVAVNAESPMKMIHTGKKVTESSWNEIKNLFKLGDVVVCRVPNDMSLRTKTRRRRTIESSDDSVSESSSDEEDEWGDY